MTQARQFVARLPCRGQIIHDCLKLYDFRRFFKGIEKLILWGGTPLERSGPKFCAKSRPRELRSIYGDPFHEDFVLIGGHEGSGPSSHTFGPLWQTHSGRCGWAGGRFASNSNPTGFTNPPCPHTRLLSCRCRGTKGDCYLGTAARQWHFCQYFDPSD